MCLPALASADWAVTFQINEIQQIQRTDAINDDDYYVKIFITGVTGGTSSSIGCNTKRYHQDNVANPRPDWTCAADVTGVDPIVSFRIELWDHDGNLFDPDDDRIDISPNPGLLSLTGNYRPASNQLTLEGPIGPLCSGRTQSTGDSGDRASIFFTVAAGIEGAYDGDSDGDGLPDGWEICGIPGISLDQMGADPLRKDLFVQLDWMVDDDTIGSDHAHEPPIASLMQAWSELQLAAVSNPPGSSPGIALHVDTGQLYENWAVDLNARIVGNEVNLADCTPGTDLDLDGDGTCESIDLDGDGFADIGNLANEGVGARIPGPEDVVLNDCGQIESLSDSIFPANRRGVFRHGIWGHQHSDVSNSSSGLSCSSRTFLVSLGTWGTRPVLNDPANTPMATPSGLPGTGSLNAHTGTFLHEMGHSMTLRHGGRNHTNYKPNYIGVMNYHFQTGGVLFDPDGDGLVDQLTGIDFNRDGVNDSRRFRYADDRNRIALDESDLDETLGVQDPTAVGLQAHILTRVGPFPSNGDGNPTTDPGDCSNNCAMLPYQLLRHIRQVRANSAVDWNRDYDRIDMGVNSLSGLYPGGIQTDVNGDGSIDTLNSWDDYDQLQNGGLSPRTRAAVIGPGVDFETEVDAEMMIAGVVGVPDQGTLESTCATAVDLIDFNAFATGTILKEEFSPAAVFPNTGTTLPQVEGLAERGGLPTQSDPQSVVNAAAVGNDAPPLEIEFFTRPVRMLGLYAGRTNFDGWLPTDEIVLSVYDIDNVLMGIVRAPLLDAAAGIMSFVGAGAVFPERPIGRITVDYDGSVNAITSPVRIDDLVLCVDKLESSVPYPEPPPPGFGDPPVRWDVKAVLLGEEPVDEGEDGHAAVTETPLVDIEVEIDANAYKTDTVLDSFEGSPHSFNAIGIVPNAVFLRWELEYANGGMTVLFGEDDPDLDLKLLRSGTLTAVYVVDADGDGYPDVGIGEFADNCVGIGNPGQEDLDGDGIGDDCDSDRDGDGLDNQVETGSGTYNGPGDTGTDPDVADTDGDGLTDGSEVNLYQTNPILRDTDGDGFGDGVEIASGTNPLDPTGPWPAADGDLAPVGASDGVVNTGDLHVAIRMALGLIEQDALALAHGDVVTAGGSAGIIDIADVVAIANLVLR